MFDNGLNSIFSIAELTYERRTEVIILNELDEIKNIYEKMAEITKREKHEPLTLREIEEEKMIAELKGMGMYEEGLTYNDMKDILRMVSESRDMAKKEADNNVMQRTHSAFDFMSEVAPKANSSKELDTYGHNDIPQPSYSYRASCISPAKFDHCLNQDSSSPEMFETNGAVSKHKNSGNDASEVSHESPSVREYMLRSRNCLQDTQNSHISEIKMDVHHDHSHKMDRWKTDPFVLPVDEKDVPLKEPKRPLAQERVPFRLCKEVWSSEKLDEIIAAVNMHLKEIAELWHSRHRTNLSSEFQWGSPIQVDASKASADKTPLITNRNVQRTVEYTNNDSHEQGSKRKASESIAGPYSSDDVDDNNSTSIKKKKYLISTEKLKTPNSIKENPNTLQSKKKQPVEILLNNLDDLEVKSTHQFTEKSVPSEVEPLYPRRIIPPNPSKKPSADCKTERSEDNSLSENVQSLFSKIKGTTVKLSEASNTTGLVKGIIKEDAQTKSEAENIEIKPLPMKSLLVRLNRQCTMLKQNHIKEELKVSTELEEEKKRKEEEKNARQEKLMSAIKEHEIKRKKEEQLQKTQQEKTEKWNERLRLKERTECFRKYQEKPEKEEESVFMDNKKRFGREDKSSTSAREKVDCPICNRSFSTSEIESHAAQCEQYTSENEDVITQNDFTAKHVCYICSFKTNDDNEYHEHVSECIRHQTPNTAGSSDIIIDNIPTSPIRSFQSISEVKNSEVDYKKQFPTTSRAKKRKR